MTLLRRTVGLVGLCWLLLGCQQAVAAEVRWHAFVPMDANGKDIVPFGYQRMEVADLPDGQKQFTVETKLLIDLLGQRQEIVTSGTYIVTASLRPVSFRTQTQSLSGTSVAEGEAKGGQLHVRRTTAGVRSELAVPLGPEIIFEVCLEDWLRNSKSDTNDDGVTFEVIDEESWTCESRLARRTAADQWEVKQTLGIARITLGDDGQAAKFESDVPPISWIRSDASVVEKIRHRELAGRDVLMFPVGRSLPFPEKRTSITVQLTWTGFPKEQLHLEDCRQKLLSHTVDGDKHQAVVKLTQRQLTNTTANPPADEPRWRPYLAETRYIKPADPEIESTAKRWTADAKTSLEVARALAQGVFDHLQGGELIAETLSGPEVLRCKKGKCSEYTTLYASLARALSLPTRVALGERLVGESWIGHMWCEVYLGDWVPVDASANEVGGSPALLKFVHSDTVLGTQKARFGLAKSLEIAVVEVDPTNIAAGNLKTGIAGQTFTQADFGCRVTAPQGWRLEDIAASGATVVQFHVPKEPAEKPPLVHFVAFSLPAPLPATLLVTTRRVRFAGMYKDFTVLSDEAMQVSGLAGRRFVFRRRGGKTEAEKMKTTEVIWTRGNAGFLLNLIASEADHDGLLADFERILQSFELQSPSQ